MSTKPFVGKHPTGGPNYPPSGLSALEHERAHESESSDGSYETSDDEEEDQEELSEGEYEMEHIRTDKTIERTSDDTESRTVVVDEKKRSKGSASASPSPSSSRSSVQQVQQSPTTKGRSPYTNGSANRTAASANGNGSVASKGASLLGRKAIEVLRQLDMNLVPEDDNTFDAYFDLVFNATRNELFRDGNNQITFSKDDLKKIFKVYVKNPDRMFEDGSFYGDPVMKDFFLSNFAITKTSCNSMDTIAVACTRGLEELNAVTVRIKGATDEKVMHTLSGGNVTYGQEGLTLVDNSAMLGTKTFLTFGHLDLARIMENVVSPSSDDPDERLKVPLDTQLANLILQPANKAELQGNGSGENRKIDIDGGYVRVGSDALVEVFAIWQDKIQPTVRGKNDLSGGLTFELIKIADSSQTVNKEQAPVNPLKEIKDIKCQIVISCAVKYAYSKGSRDKSTKKPKTITERQDPKCAFEQKLKQRLDEKKSSSSHGHSNMPASRPLASTGLRKANATVKT